MLHSNLKMTALTIIIDHFDNIIDRMYYLLLYSQKIYKLYFCSISKHFNNILMQS